MITYQRKSRLSLKGRLLTGALLTIAASANTVVAQDSTDMDEVVVTGTRAIIQDSISLKRESTTIVDGLSASEIGDLPALSIGEALETITGASSHRENGGATEISIRGLGPFLSSTVFNGREATNGSGDRSVNFSQFPSELMNKLSIYKTQDASLIEGGVAGQISLETLKPLEYGKQRFQFDVKGNVNPDQLNIDDTMEGDLGYRLTGSYVDQFDLSGGGAVGLSVGGQISAISQPEQEIRSSSPTGSSRWACLINGTGDNVDQGFTENASREDDCEDDNLNGGNDAYDNSIDPATGLAVDNGEQYTFAMSQRGFRQNDTSDKRDSLFGALQFQPNDKLDINLDAQWSDRTQSEERNDFNLDNSRRNSTGLSGIGGFTSTVDSLLTDGQGETLRIAYETDLMTGGEIYERREKYLGFGGSIGYDVSDRLSANLDVSRSKTTRTEFQQSMRVQTPSRVETIYSIENGFPEYQFLNFDVTDISNYDDNIRLRVDSDVDRENTVSAARLDFNYDMGEGLISSIDVGGRIAELGYTNLTGARDEYTLSDGDASIYACEVPFAESDFLSSVSSGPLFTSVDLSGGTNTAGTGSSWATLDMQCLSDAILAGNGATLAFPELDPEDSRNTDVTEKTLAAYIKANYEGALGSTPIRGNIGVRIVDTEVESVGYRDGYTIGTDVNGSLILNRDSSVNERVVGGGGYTELLPSFNLVADVGEDFLFRGGIFRGLSRADPADMSYARSFSGATPEPGEIISDPEDLLIVSAGGNPNFQPLTSWNFDGALEWYPNEDSLLAVGLYHKRFIGGFENAVNLEDFTVDGSNVTLPVTIQSTNQDTANLTGIEVTATHRFSNLPGLLSGLGAKVSYNYADSDFEFQDSNYGERGVRELDGSFTQTHVALVAPGNIPGLSKHVLSAQLYWSWDDFDIAGYYKYRDDYFQPYTSNGTRLRFVGANEVFEARASYRINDNYKVSIQGLNLFNEPRVDYFYQKNNFGQSSVYGPRIFVGLQGRF